MFNPFQYYIQYPQPLPSIVLDIAHDLEVAAARAAEEGHETPSEMSEDSVEKDAQSDQSMVLVLR